MQNDDRTHDWKQRDAAIARNLTANERHDLLFTTPAPDKIRAIVGRLCFKLDKSSEGYKRVFEGFRRVNREAVECRERATYLRSVIRGIVCLGEPGGPRSLEEQAKNMKNARALLSRLEAA